jgi:hypothetical protein
VTNDKGGLIEGFFISLSLFFLSHLPSLFSLSRLSFVTFVRTVRCDGSDWEAGFVHHSFRGCPVRRLTSWEMMGKTRDG